MGSNPSERARDLWLEKEGCDEALRALGSLAPSCLVNGGDASLAVRADVEREPASIRFD